jgi:hypothetical protein
MNMLISGCSFTQWPEFPGGPNTCWPRYLSELRQDLNITSLAEAAAGNQYISDSIIREILEKPNYYDMIIVMWSGVTRLDFLTDVSDPNWSALFDSYGFYRRLPGGKLGWIFSGGQMGTWFKHPVAHKMFYEQYKVSSELTLAYTNLIEMVKLQNFLENKKIPYKFMSYVNYWNNIEHVSPNGDFGVFRYTELKSVINEIDFNQWIFKNDQRDGVYELAKELNNFEADGFHPGLVAYKQWAEFVNTKI